jgi:hypothetical protein
MPIRIEVRMQRHDPWREVKRQALETRLKNAVNEAKNHGVTPSADEIEAIMKEIQRLDGPPSFIISE